MKITTRQLRQIIREEIENITTEKKAVATDTLPDYAGFYTVKGFQKGDFMLIKPDTKLKVGQDVVTMNNTQFGTISKIDGNSYTITWDDYGDKVRTNRQKLEKFWLLVKKGR